jgi:hypothetical protein
MKRIIYTGIALVLTASCTQRQEGRSATQVVETPRAVMSEASALPSPVSKARTGALKDSPQSYAELVASSTAAERQILDFFYSSFGAVPDASGKYAYAHIFDYKDLDQLNWLLANGFPSSEEILAASRLDDYQLAGKVEQGDWRTASVLLTRPGGQKLEPKVRFALADQAMKRGTAYGGYVVALDALQSHRPADAVAGLAWAFYRGDIRSFDFMPEEARVVDSSSVAAAMLKYMSSQGNSISAKPFPM